MFYTSLKHLFDTVFVIICVIAGATSQAISNTSKPSINQLSNHYRASFMDFILDASLIDLLQTSNTIDKDSAIKYSSDYKSTATNSYQQSQTVCAMLSNLISGNHMKFCIKHQDILEAILPQVVQLTRKECARVTHDLKWNCPTIEVLLDRSNQLAFTKEAALVRSILSASMMYLVIKSCNDHRRQSCGCHNSQYLLQSNISARLPRQPSEIDSSEGKFEIVEKPGLNHSAPDNQEFSASDLTKLNSGSPLHLAKPVYISQDCLASIAFANAFTKVFFDFDDTKALSKANRILNEDRHYNGPGNKSFIDKRLADSDYKDLASIKWTKSAINLHNNHVGRQMVREATQRRCRCHGLSAVCQFQTCWDQLNDFSTITSRIRSLYLSHATHVEGKNLGSFDKPDLSLVRKKQEYDPETRPNGNQSPSVKTRITRVDRSLIANSDHDASLTGSIDKIKPGELLYLYDSPNFCEPQPYMRHLGTEGRFCAPATNITTIHSTSKKNTGNAGSDESGLIDINSRGTDGAPGSCEQLCCNRGYHSELVLDMVTCNCRFKFCCQVDCEPCLQQRVHHFCL